MSRASLFSRLMAAVTLAVLMHPAAAAPAVAADRWMEIDLYWFEQKDIAGSVNRFWDRVQPLYQGVEGYRGLILNVGWTVQFIMDWSGDLEQCITLPAGSGQEPWVPQTGPLSGTTEERRKQWKERFARPVLVERHGYEPWTYGDLGTLAAALRAVAAKRGIGNFRVGALAYAWPRAYGEEAPWVRRHPEAFTRSQFEQAGAYNPGPYFDPNATLHADDRPLGGLPRGIPEGLAVHQAFAAQWGSLSQAVGLDAIMLRDSFGMMMPYQRGGPFGIVAPSPDIAGKYSAGVAALVRESKQANPGALLMMYSNAASAVADWRSNCVDIESIAREGYLDIWVDQTWAGAWNEVGVRHNSFWNMPTLGWTYQLANMLIHAAVLADTKVRHYPLVETFDAWESWDVLHTVPQRLRWGIWAYSHAAVKTPHGLRLPEGTYISWANQGKRLLSDTDVAFLVENVNAAVADARQMSDVIGPTLVYSREAVVWQMAHAAPDRDFKEWVDEQAGSLMKWPVPVLSVTRVEWLPAVRSDLFMVQTPAHLSPRRSQDMAALIRAGRPLALFGTPAGPLFALAGLTGVRAQEHRPRQRTAGPRAGSGKFARNIPDHFTTYTWIGKNQAAADARVLYAVEDNPVLTINTAAGKRVLAWDPPEFRYYGDLPLREAWSGGAAAYALTAGAVNSLLASPETLHAAEIDLNQTMNVSAWRNRDGQVRLLAANLEEGLREDADMSRQATLVLPESWNISGLSDRWSGRNFAIQKGAVTIKLAQAQSVLLVPETPPETVPPATPAARSHFRSLRMGQVLPAGWIKAQMQRDLREGLAGKLDQLTPEVDTDIFDKGRNRPGKPNVPAAGDADGAWWNGEAEGNWRAGYIMMAFLSGDVPAQERARTYVRHILNSQDPDGYIGVNSRELRFSDSRVNGEVWTQTCILRALLAYYELTGERQVLDAVERAVAHTARQYKDRSRTVFGIPEASYGISHALMFVDVMEALFRLTGKDVYRDLGLWLYQDFQGIKLAKGLAPAYDATLKSLLDMREPWAGHGAHTYSHIRVPLWAYFVTGQPEYRQAYENAFEKLKWYLLPGGAAVSMEDILGRTADPTETPYEYCAMKELVVTFGSALQKTGRAEFAGRLEELIFNAAQGARTPDGKAITYLTRDNRYRINGNPSGLQREKFSPTHCDVAVCCSPNATQTMPHYVRQMWMQTPNGGLAAVLYGPSSVNAEIGGVAVRIEESTDYPFSPRVSMHVSPQRPIAFDLVLRNPAWSIGTRVRAAGARITRDGDYFIVRKQWKPRDRVLLEFTEQVEAVRIAAGELAVRHGPLVYALRIPEVEHKSKTYSLPGFADMKYLPASNARWEFALDLSGPLQTQFAARRSSDRNPLYPYDDVSIRLEGKLINLGNCALEPVSLIPMGSGRAILRRVTFPDANLKTCRPAVSAPR